MSGERARILIVDDLENMRALLRDILAGQHDVSLAGDGAAARAELESGTVDLVMTDVRMPGLDGFELVRFVKDRWPLSSREIIFRWTDCPSVVGAGQSSPAAIVATSMAAVVVFRRMSESSCGRRGGGPGS